MQMGKFRRNRKPIRTFVSNIYRNEGQGIPSVPVVESWFKRNVVLVQWATLIGLAISSSATYFLSWKAEIRQEKANEQIIAQGKITQDLSMKQAALTDATLSDLSDPIKKSYEAALLEQTRIARVVTIDELVETLRPNIQATLLGPEKMFWENNFAVAHFNVTNLGKRGVVVSVVPSLPADFDRTDAKGNVLRASDFSISSNSVGYLSPGQTSMLQVTINSKIPLKNIDSLPFTCIFSMETHIPFGSETYKAISTFYSKPYIDGQLKKVFRYQTNIAR